MQAEITLRTLIESGAVAYGAQLRAQPRVGGQLCSLNGTLRKDGLIEIEDMYPTQTNNSPTGFCKRAIQHAGFQGKCNGWKDTFIVGASGSAERSLDDLRQQLWKQKLSRHRRQMSDCPAFWEAADRAAGVGTGSGGSSPVAAPGSRIREHAGQVGIVEDLCSQESAIDLTSSQGDVANTCDNVSGDAAVAGGQLSHQLSAGGVEVQPTPTSTAACSTSTAGVQEIREPSTVAAAQRAKGKRKAQIQAELLERAPATLHDDSNCANNNKYEARLPKVKHKKLALSKSSPQRKKKKKDWSVRPVGSRVVAKRALSVADVKHGKDPADEDKLQKAMTLFRAKWRKPDHEEVQAMEIQLLDGVEGLYSCNNFLSIEEVQALRLFFDAHDRWTQYQYGKGTLPRLDFSEHSDSCRAEGVLGADNVAMHPLKGVRSELQKCLADRFLVVFKLGSGASTVWSSGMPNALQLTQIPPHTTLANHFDSRTKWLEGIATIAFSQGPGLNVHHEPDLRGDFWRLCMERNGSQSIAEFDSGAAYIISGAAQGTANVCKQGCEAHKKCTCCWTVGVLYAMSLFCSTAVLLQVILTPFDALYPYSHLYSLLSLL